jgi:pentose-5-phosphate-3-epimerase
MKIIPTILTTNIEEFKSQMQLFPKYFSRIQLDIADGKLVPNKTTQIEEMNTLMSNEQLVITNRDTLFDFHLMVEDYESELEKIQEFSHYQKIGAVLINASLKPELKKIEQQYPLFSIGLDIYPKVTIEEIVHDYDLNTLSALQIMSVNPGFQGSPFLEDMLLKIEQLRNNNYRNIIFMDGGINDKTLPLILSKNFQPDYGCVGSYLTKAGDKLDERFEYIKTFEK